MSMENTLEEITKHIFEGDCLPLIQMKPVLIFSGGFDSTIALSELVRQGFTDITCLSFDYGQRAQNELESAKIIAKFFNVKHEIFDITEITKFLNSNALTNHNINVPKTDNEEAVGLSYVPSRNTILIELATAYAISNGLHCVVFGAHYDDVEGYPDCRLEFVNKINQLNAVNNKKYIPVFAPFIHKTKKDLVKIAIKTNAPHEMSWSCYENGDEPCGKCASCLERINGFMEAEKEMEEENVR